MLCPNCKADTCERDSVHNGVMMLYGPWGCPSCRWSEDPEYDFSGGKSAVQEDGGVLDQYGGKWPAARFGRKPA